MNGKAHLLSALFVIGPGLLAFLARGVFSLPEALLAALGVLLGVIAPDVDAAGRPAGYWPSLGGYRKSSAQQAAEKIAGHVTRLFALASRYLFFEPLVLFLHLVGYRRIAKHRGVMHSLMAAVLCTSFWILVLLAASFLAGVGPQPAFVFGAGLLAGFLFHLYADSLTPHGVNWLFPHEFVLRGRIKTQPELQSSKTRFFESQLYGLSLFALIGTIVLWLLLKTAASPFFLSLLTVFCLLLASLMMGMEVSIEGWNYRPPAFREFDFE